MKLTVSEAIRLELLKLRASDINAREISELSGIDKTKVWRLLNLVPPLDLKCIEALEKVALINPLGRILQGAYGNLTPHRRV